MSDLSRIYQKTLEEWLQMDLQSIEHDALQDSYNGLHGLNPDALLRLGYRYGVARGIDVSDQVGPEFASFIRRKAG